MFTAGYLETRNSASSSSFSTMGHLKGQVFPVFLPMYSLKKGDTNISTLTRNCVKFSKSAGHRDRYINFQPGIIQGKGQRGQSQAPKATHGPTRRERQATNKQKNKQTNKQTNKNRNINNRNNNNNENKTQTHDNGLRRLHDLFVQSDSILCVRNV